MDVINTLFGLLGGLSLFLFGMEMMSDGLQKAAGNRMKHILGLLTKNPVMGVLAGAVTTTVLQSSSATTVMVIGFASAGLMNLPQAISVIMGANIGTTITAQIIAFHIDEYIFPILFIGFFIAFVAKRETVKYVGNTIFGFGILFIGIEVMGSAMKPIADSPVVLNLIARVADIPILGMLFGAGITVLVQSSSAVIAILQNFASQAGPDGMSSVLGLRGAIPILLGSNIGTTITALLACIGQPKDAKRTAAAHSIFNITGSVFFLFILPWFAELITAVSPSGAEVEIISRQIANAHTVFNIGNTLVWIPLIRLMVKMVMWILPDEKKDEPEKAGLQFLDVKVSNQPVAALHLVSKEIMHYTKQLEDFLAEIKKALLDGGQENLLQADCMAEQAAHAQEEISNYLLGLFSSGSMNEEQAAHTTEMMYIVEDLGRIARGMRELLECAREKAQKGVRFSKKAMAEIAESLEIVTVMYRESVDLIQYGDKAAMSDTERYLKRIVKLEKHVRKNHKKRIKEGKCRPEFTNIFANIFHSMERIGENCGSITESAAEDMYLKYLPEENSQLFS
ncbi:MAG: Na/Pi cotransporter family protein [Bacteroidales bacterium]|nr:Na/Pi cotransporter family protein [Clostridium sp.]MCM1204129.1 Na/Pi cotransporter family protein [Bacteroidales bacterium]